MTLLYEMPSEMVVNNDRVFGFHAYLFDAPEDEEDFRAACEPEYPARVARLEWVGYTRNLSGDDLAAADLYNKAASGSVYKLVN